MVDRKRRMLVLGGAAAALPGLVPASLRAQGLPRVAFVIGGNAKSGESYHFVHEFSEGMRELGYREGKNYALDVRSYGSERARVRRLADQLVAAKPAVVVANVSSTAYLLRQRTSDIPIVMVAALDPVGEGLAATLAHPGGNVTGMTSLSEELHARLVELLLEIVPRIKRVALLVNPARALAKSELATVASAAERLGITLVPLELRTAAATRRLADRLSSAQVDALIVAADALLFSLRERIIEAALSVGVPAISALPEFAQQGALASYGADVSASFRAAGRYVDRILKGAKPGDLPIEQPRRFELVLNLKTARALHLVVPRDVLLRADRVIE